MKVMIIGSEGYLGTALVGELRRNPKLYELNLVDACLWGQRPSHGCYVPRGCAQILWHVDRYRPDVLVWLAALAHDPQGRLRPQDVMYNNATLPALGAQWALEQGKRFVGVSSYSIFTRGPCPGAYPESKRKLEGYLYDLEPWRGINLVRFGTLWGHTEFSRPETFRPHLLLNSMVLDAVTSGTIKIPDKALSRPVTHLEDAVLAVQGAIEAPVPGLTMNVHTCSATLRQFAEAVAEVVPGTRIEEVPASKETDKRDYQFGPAIQIMAPTLRRQLQWFASDFARPHSTQLMALRQSCFEPMLLRAGCFCAK